jgi:hypothetical protein
VQTFATNWFWRLYFLKLGILFSFRDSLISSATEGIKGDFNRVILIKIESCCCR